MNLRPLLRTLPLVLLCGCAQILGIEDTELDETPPAPTGPWRCVTGLQVQPPPQPPASITLSMNAFIFAPDDSGAIVPTPQKGINFRACASRSDVKCEKPLAQQDSGDDGTVQLSISTPGGQGFNGYVKISDPTQKFITFHYFFSNTLYENLTAPGSLMATQADVDDLATKATLSFDPVVGAGVNHISATSLDCDRKAAPNVKFSFSNPTEGSLPWYFQGSAASSAAQSTDGNGLGGILNLIAGGREYAVTAINTDQQTVSFGSVILSDGAFSTILMLPR